MNGHELNKWLSLNVPKECQYILNFIYSILGPLAGQCMTSKALKATVEHNSFPMCSNTSCALYLNSVPLLAAYRNTC